MLPDNAQRLLDAGFYLLPVDRRKVPVCRNGVHDATQSAEELGALYERAQADPRLTATRADGEGTELLGPIQFALQPRLSNLIVVDVDPRNFPRTADPETGEITTTDPRDTLRALGVDLDGTSAVLTPSGGEHYYFRAPSPAKPGEEPVPVPSCEPLKGIDLKADTGYVVAPGSLGPVRQDGSDAPGYTRKPGSPHVFLPFPVEIFATLHATRKAEAKSRGNSTGTDISIRRTTNLTEILAGTARIPKGERDDTFFALASRLRRDDKPISEAAQILGDIFEGQTDNSEPGDSSYFSPEQVVAKLERAYALFDPEPNQAPSAVQADWAAGVLRPPTSPAPTPGTDMTPYHDAEGVIEDDSDYTAPDIHPVTDIGFMRRVLDRFGPVILHSNAVKDGFYTYDPLKGIWRHDHGASLQTIIASVSEHLYGEEEFAFPDDGDKQKFLAWCAKYQDQGKIRAVMNLLSKDPAVQVEESEWDADPRYLCLADGVLDLHNPKTDDNDNDVYDEAGCPLFNVLEHAPHFKFRHALISNHRSEAMTSSGSHGHWLRFIESVLPDDEARDFFQEVVGYSLSGKGTEKYIFLIYGPNDTSKSATMSALIQAFKMFTTTVSSDTIAPSKGKFPDPQNQNFVDLPGKRFLFFDEPADKAVLDAALLKRLASSDEWTAARKYGQPFTFTNRATVFIPTNHLPAVSDTSLWSRIVLLPFDHVVPDEKRVSPEQLAYWFEEDADVILAWALQGRDRWLRRGRLDIPDMLRSITKEWRADEDWLLAFSSSYLTTTRHENGSPQRVLARDVYAAYTAWAHTHPEFGQPESANAFGRALTRNYGRTIERKELSAGKTYIGLGLLPTPRTPDTGSAEPTPGTPPAAWG